MATIERSIDVNVPISTAYNQWTQFEEFPRFMENIIEVRQVDDTRLHWIAEVDGQREEWDAEIVEQHPDRMIAWHAISGRQNAGLVKFMPENGGTRVTFVMEDESMSIEQDLERFKDMIESRGRETGAWRGQVHDGDAQVDNSSD